MGLINCFMALLIQLINFVVEFIRLDTSTEIMELTQLQSLFVRVKNTFCTSDFALVLWGPCLV
jgi:hypothetical protein